jgi:hypothetical protein
MCDTSELAAYTCSKQNKKDNGTWRMEIRRDRVFVHALTLMID